MSDQPQKRRLTISMALAVIVLLVLYVLSIGPVSWLVLQLDFMVLVGRGLCVGSG